MRLRLAALVALVLVLPIASGVAAPKPSAAGDYIVVLRGGSQQGARAKAVDAASSDLSRLHGLQVTNVYHRVLQGFAAHVPAGEVDRLRADPRVASVEPDLPGEFFGQTLPTGVDRIGADSQTEGTPPTKAGRPVAVLDSGIDPHHPDLHVVGGYNCTSRNRKSWHDVYGHGTHVSGIIGARNNGFGVVGVAPGTPLWAIKVGNDQGNIMESWVICGLDWVAKHAKAKGIVVANMSMGGYPSADDPHDCASSALHTAICNAAKHVPLVVAAGNSHDDALNYWPGKYDQVITVSALADSDGCAGGHGPATSAGPDDTFASFSNYGPAIDVAAPGVDILSTLPGGKYGYWSGTSMAAPHVTGAIALGWNGLKDPSHIPNDPDGIDEGVLLLSNHTACRS